MASPAPTRRQIPQPDPSPVLSPREKKIFAYLSGLPDPYLKEVEEYVRRKKQDIKKRGLLKRGLQAYKRRSSSDVTFTHPVAVIEELAEAVAIPRHTLEGSGMGDVLSAKNGLVRLQASTVDDASTDWAETELLGAGELADRLGVARTSINNWRVAGKVVAFQKGVRNYVYPVRQFNDHAPIRGIEHVLRHFNTPEDAWEWLVTPNRITLGELPIERLRADKVDEVTRAAEGGLDFA